MLVQFGNNWIKKIPRNFSHPIISKLDKHVVLLPINWRAGCITALCRILGRFSIFLRFVRSSVCELQFDWKTLSSFFFWPICVSYSRNNVCKRTVFPHPERKHCRFLCVRNEKHSSLHTLFLEYETQIGQKKNWTMFFNRIAVHMQNFRQIWEKSKNGLKFDIRRLCIQPFNYRASKNSLFKAKLNVRVKTIQFNWTIQFIPFREKTTKIVSKRVDDFRERTQPQLGQVHDPIKDTLRVPGDHTFGVMVKPDEYGAGDLIHMRVPSKFLRGRDRERGVMAAVRHHLKKANYHNFYDLKAAFEYYDQVRG